ncbi:melanotransferrin [Ischnura elegans]|uniref:melanotransferrin n=1 Tax=Ischnura elegans TaxID=197161 RepID=UPI001ED88F58|nr:melanotransferrin [Ischnura elegans]
MGIKYCVGISLLIWAFSLCVVSGETLEVINEETELIWCTVSIEEQSKCKNLSRAIDNDINSFGYDRMKLRCKRSFNKDECMSQIDEETAHITSLDAGEVFVGGRYHSLIPIMQEVYEGGDKFYYAVAVMKKGSLPEVQSIGDLKGKKACFAGVGTLAGWVIPVYTLMQQGGLEIIDCNNHVKSATNFFGPSCAVNALINKNNPVGDNSNKLCQLCGGHSPGQKCTEADPYAGYEGAFRCLVEAGDVAFLKHTTVETVTGSGIDLASVSDRDFELLCLDGNRRDLRDYKLCNWGTVPSHAIVTTSAKSSQLRRKYYRFMKKIVELFGKPPYNSTSVRGFGDSSTTRNPFGESDDFNRDFGRRREFDNSGGVDGPRNYNDNTLTRDSNDYDSRGVKPLHSDSAFHLFESAPKYGLKNSLLFQDTARDVHLLPESQQTYKGYLGKSLKLILGVRDCPVRRMTLCVTSDPELDKCVKMKIALKAQLLKPEMSCFKAASQIRCMQAVQTGVADVTVLDAGDIYTGGLRYDLIPFIAEVYNLGAPEYYVVAVAKEEDPDTELTFLKGKNTCHTGMQMASGWVIPMAYIISNGWIRSYGCDSVQAAAQYFTKSCVPGAISPEYNSGVPYDNMCDLCHGSSNSYCKRDASEAFYGHTGAFRCLVEGGGDVAFVKHTTVMENTDGKRKEWWARNTLTNDFQLLCRDGRRAAITDYAKCNLGKAKANAIVARGGLGFNETELNAFANLFVYAQQFYGRKFQDDFRLFYSAPPYSDLIFQDATLQLHVLEKSKQNYRSYLGRNFLRARALVDCYAGAWASSASLLLVSLSSVILVFIVGRP